jgi:hypothetical protein
MGGGGGGGEYEVGVNAACGGIWKALRVKARRDTAIMVDVVALKVITVSSGLEVDYRTQSMPLGGSEGGNRSPVTHSKISSKNSPR